ncbi:M20/M25/M40 family metallo-hydrolase [Janibacter limosus]|uniref:M20/M25/M40 family metallo-hydrolase n=1 Tax=Janibacter limosus TaxID=53458 RepID=UPI000830CB51|nr:M20/M25/M40 family metallo-hydrolase [Janibacter limosus]
MRSRTAAATAAAATAALAITTLATGPAQAKNPNNSKKMTQAVTVENVHGHLEAFQAIADANDGNRGAGTSGYEASAQYVEATLRDAGYTTQRQDFSFVYEEVHESSLTEVSPEARTVDGIPMSYSQPTPVEGVTAELAAPTTAIGCTTGDYAGADVAGKIALVSRGECSFGEKAIAAKAAGADAVIIYNNTTGALNGTLGGVEPDSAPASGVTQEEGQALLAKMAAGPVTMKLVLTKTMEERQTFNIIAETDAGRDDNVVMLGAHLDSVGDGPGINDNGSGSAGILETAVQLAKVNKLNNKVRFAFWGAEELGLLGSDHYVADLQDNDPAALDDIATYLNFDMIGSPNHIIGVYDADESTYEAPVEVPEGSAATEKVFTDYFDSTNQPWVDTEFSGRSDYSAFIAAGVPASGLFTGADGTKTPEEVEKFGGEAGIIYDPNYHTPADDITNINMEALDIMSDAIAHSTITLAQSTQDINGKTSRGKSGKPGPTVLPDGVEAA